MPTNEGELKEEVRIEHKPSKDFVSHTATGALLSGPTSDEFYHLVFYADVVEINYEVSVLVSQDCQRTLSRLFHNNFINIYLSNSGLRKIFRNSLVFQYCHPDLWGFGSNGTESRVKPMSLSHRTDPGFPRRN
jgi:hypothetical protein